MLDFDVKTMAAVGALVAALSGSGTAILGGISMDDIQHMDVQKISRSMGEGGKKIVDAFADVMDAVAKMASKR